MDLSELTNYLQEGVELAVAQPLPIPTRETCILCLDGSFSEHYVVGPEEEFFLYVGSVPVKKHRNRVYDVEASQDIYFGCRLKALQAGEKVAHKISERFIQVGDQAIEIDFRAEEIDVKVMQYEGVGYKAVVEVRSEDTRAMDSVNRFLNLYFPFNDATPDENEWRTRIEQVNLWFPKR